jgi:hypothetical protein
LNIINIFNLINNKQIKQLCTLILGDRKKKNTNTRSSTAIQSLSVYTIVIKPGPGVDPAKGRGPEFHGSTQVNPEKLKKIKVLIFHMEKSM